MSVVHFLLSTFSTTDLITIQTVFFKHEIKHTDPLNLFKLSPRYLISTVFYRKLTTDSKLAA